MKEVCCYIGLDVGTSGCKASVVDDRGRILASARREYSFENPGPGRVELNPVMVWGNVKETLKEVAAAGYKPRLMSVSSIGEALVLMDREDRVLQNGIIYLDERGPETMEEIREKISDRQIHRLTGIPMNFIYSLNRLLWLRRHEPRVIEKTSRYFMFGDYIIYMLTGERIIDPSTASKSMMLDAWKLDWADEIGTLFQVPFEQFSPVAPTGTVAGRIRKKLAEELGLPVEMKVAAGCHDQCAATLGSGGVSAGDMAAGEGSTESLNLVAEKEAITEPFLEKNICFEPYVKTGQYQIPVGQFSHGTCLRWFVREFGWDFQAGPGQEPRDPAKEGKSVYDLAAETCAADAGELFFLPYMTRSKLMEADNPALGVFTGVDVNASRGRMYRALLEGLCFESRKSFDILETAVLPVHKIVATGGCSRSRMFMQMKADVLEKPVSVLKNTDAGITGLAMICAVADGQYQDYKEAAALFVKTEEELKPGKDYREKYARYCKISRAAKELYQNL